MSIFYIADLHIGHANVIKFDNRPFADLNEKGAVSKDRIRNLRYYHAILLAANETVFITVPDDLIGTVWEQCLRFPVAGKCFFHCSGALSSTVFSNHAEAAVHVGSAHPVCAVSSRESSEVFSGKFFVLEGDATGTEMLESLMMKMNNPRII